MDVNLYERLTAVETKVGIINEMVESIAADVRAIRDTQLVDKGRKSGTAGVFTVLAGVIAAAGTAIAALGTFIGLLPHKGP